MAKHRLTVKYIGDIKKAMKMFGEYSYYDKGASEVMEIETKPYFILSQKERLQVAKEMMAYEHGEPFCRELAGEIYSQEQDENNLLETDIDEIIAIIEPE